MAYDSSIIVKSRKLRRIGYSYADICRILQISKSTAHLWTKQVECNPEIIREKRKLAHLKSVKTKQQNKKDFVELIQKEQESYLRSLLLSDQTRLQAALLYWCEGEKNCNRVVFMNSDSNLLRTFIFLMRKGFTLKESKWRVVLHLHEYHDRQKIMEYWSNLLKIPQTQFNKPYLKPHTGIRKHPDYKGCVSLRYSDYKLALEIESLMKAFVRSG